MLELFPEGFEELGGDGGALELAAYTNAAGEERIWQAFGGAAASDVEEDWQDRWRQFHKPVRVGQVVTSDIFYQPDPSIAGRWSDRGILAVEMEAAVLFTLGALRKFQAGCMLIVSDVIVEGEFLRISDEDMKKAVDEMTELALHTVTAS